MSGPERLDDAERCWRCSCIERDRDGLVCGRCGHIHQAPSDKEWSNV